MQHKPITLPFPRKRPPPKIKCFDVSPNTTPPLLKHKIKTLPFPRNQPLPKQKSAHLRRHLTVVGFLQLTRLVVEVHQGGNQGKGGEEHEEDGLDAKAGRRRGPVLVAAGSPGLDLFVEQARILAAGRLFGFGVLVVLLFARHGGGVVVGVGRSLK